MKSFSFPVVALALTFSMLPGCDQHRDEQTPIPHKIVVTAAQVMPVTITQKYVCQIRSKRHIEIRALERGYLEKISVKEGQEVKEGDVIFNVMPVIYKAKLDAELADQNLARMQYNNSKRLSEDKVVSENEVLLQKAKLSRAEAKATRAAAELNFAAIKAPFDGIIDRIRHQQGSLVKEQETLTTLSDNSVMWVYFNVPEANYLEYMSRKDQHHDELTIELLLADGTKFPQMGTIGAIEADFNNVTGNIAFRADFPNPDGLLRHGQTGTVLISRIQNDVIIIPQRATFQVSDKWFVYTLNDENTVHRREIEIENELDDIFVIKAGLQAGDKFVLEGMRQVHDGEKVEYEIRPSEQVIEHQKYHAE